MAAWLAEVHSSTIDELAERFAMTPEAVRADVSVLVMTSVGPDGGDFLSISYTDDGEVVSFERDLFTKPLRLTPEDAFAVLAAGQAMVDAAETAAAPHLASALEKVRTALGERDTLAVEAPAPPHLAALRRAAERQRTVDMRYHSNYRDEVSDRSFDPYLVYFSDGQWYTRGYDHSSEDPGRIFRIDRVLAVSTTEDTFERRPSDTTAATFVRTEATVDVELRVPPSGRWVLEAYDVLRSSDLDDGWTELVLPVTGDVWLAELLLRLGPGAIVVEPDGAGDAGRALARRMLDLYGD